MKGVILAGGVGSRLFPLTKAISKHLLPIYDKPLIYYPITTLILAGIREILIVTTPQDRQMFESLLGDGSQWSIKIRFCIQESPGGIPHGLLLAEEFVGDDNLCLILGDNLFYGTGLGRSLSDLMNSGSQKSATEPPDEIGCEIFTYPVRDPQNFGIVTLDDNLNPISFEEKPEKPISNLAITGMYIFSQKCFQYSRSLLPSERGEIEIIDLIRKYFVEGKLKINFLGRGTAWLDTGTFKNLHDAASFIRIIQERQGVKIGDPYEASQIQGWI